MLLQLPLGTRCWSRLRLLLRSPPLACVSPHDSLNLHLHLHLHLRRRLRLRRHLRACMVPAPET